MKQDDEIKSIGKWHLGHKYNIDDWGVGFFKAREEKEMEDGTYYLDWYLAVCENSFFVFEPDSSAKSGAKHRLLSVATLCTLERIVRNLDFPDSATFIWREIPDQPQWTLKVEITNADVCISLIVKYLKKLGIKASKKYEKKRKILVAEVTQKAYSKTNIDDIKTRIDDLEKEVKSEPT